MKKKADLFRAEKKKDIPMGIPIFVSGVAGCGKTTFINAFGEHLEKQLFKGYDIGIFKNKVRIRDLIDGYDLSGPSMLYVKESSYDTGEPQGPQVKFLRELIQWQLMLLNLHTTNMRYKSPGKQEVLLLDRSSLDSLIYLLYDIVNWSNEMTSLSKLSKQTEEGQGPEGDSARVLDDFIKGRSAGMVTQIMDTVTYHLKMRAKRKRPIEPGSFWTFRPVEDSVYEVLTGSLSEEVLKDTLRESWKAREYGDVIPAIDPLLDMDFKKQICRPLAYILCSYVELIYDVPGIYAVLTHNPHVAEVPEDGVRLTDNRLIQDLDNVTNYTLRALYRGLLIRTKNEETGMPVREKEVEEKLAVFDKKIEEGATLWFTLDVGDIPLQVVKEPCIKEMRSEDVTKDISARINWIAKNALTYVNHVGQLNS
ncbi:MAG: hypothetical protein LC687_00150 [Actinobacteria bacterium]|nr:hypothetical protein [Actinomycetota bacterium]MCA1806281.1 hypothetical protein [Actinomycetota bacterium]